MRATRSALRRALLRPLIFMVVASFRSSLTVSRARSGFPAPITSTLGESWLKTFRRRVPWAGAAMRVTAAIILKNFLIGRPIRRGFDFLNTRARVRDLAYSYYY